jgi:hypothetical protein
MRAKQVTEPDTATSSTPPPKDGIVAEMDAFEDVTEAEEKMGATRYDRMVNAGIAIRWQPEDNAEARRRFDPGPCGPDAVHFDPRTHSGDGGGS